MKHRVVNRALGIIVAAAATGGAAMGFPPPPPPPPPIALDWSSIDCGAETLTAGDLVLEGTFGQFDAGHEDDPMLFETPEGYLSFVGGFWGDDGVSDCLALQSEPSPVTACPFTGVNFSVSATGAAPFTYAWRKGGTPINPSLNPSASTATLQLASVTFADAGMYDCVVTNGCDSVTSAAARLSVGFADLGSQGGIPGADGQYDNNDFVVFIYYFFERDPLADVGSQGGVLGADGEYDNNDFIVFIEQFFSGC